MIAKFSDTKIAVFASPARRNARENPYNALLSDHLETERCRVDELTRRRSLLQKADIVHIHWPQSLARGTVGLAVKQSADFWFRLAMQKLRGAKIVWTVHNIHAHDQTNLWLERLLMTAILPMIDGLIFLSDSSRMQACAEMPQLVRKSFSVVPHGIYGDLYRSHLSVSEAREYFDLPADGRVIGFVGDIRPNKGLSDLLTAFESVGPGVTLLVAGRMGPPASFQKETTERIDELQRVGYQIVFHHRRLSNEEMVAAIRACDIVAMPYREIANSGLAILVLEHGGRILASDAPIFREMQQEVGDWWLHIVTGEWTGAALEAALDVPGPAEGSSIRSFQQRRAWPEIAALTRRFYDAVLESR